MKGMLHWVKVRQMTWTTQAPLCHLPQLQFVTLSNVTVILISATQLITFVIVLFFVIAPAPSAKRNHTPFVTDGEECDCTT